LGRQPLRRCPIIYAEKLKEKKKTNKTKGGKYTEYKYYGTWALAIADHEIDAVRGIWLDRHLCYQARAPGRSTPISARRHRSRTATERAAAGQAHARHNLRIYLGTEDQEPDPRYEAWCEDRYGEPDRRRPSRASPIDRFIDIPLEKFGNRLPQVSIEAVRTTSSIWRRGRGSSRPTSSTR
jgi:hypothetical protein